MSLVLSGLVFVVFVVFVVEELLQRDLAGPVEHHEPLHHPAAEVLDAGDSRMTRRAEHLGLPTMSADSFEEMAPASAHIGG